MSTNYNNNDRENWHNAYIHELKELYSIFLTNLGREYPNLEVKHELAFHNFSRLIFHSSSGFISMYTKQNCNHT
jgi:hypothetical protein